MWAAVEGQKTWRMYHLVAAKAMKAGPIAVVVRSTLQFPLVAGVDVAMEEISRSRANAVGAVTKGRIVLTRRWMRRTTSMTVGYTGSPYSSIWRMALRSGRWMKRRRSITVSYTGSPYVYSPFRILFSMLARFRLRLLYRHTRQRAGSPAPIYKANFALFQPPRRLKTSLFQQRHRYGHWLS